MLKRGGKCTKVQRTAKHWNSAYRGGKEKETVPSVCVRVCACVQERDWAPETERRYEDTTYQEGWIQLSLYEESQQYDFVSPTWLSLRNVERDGCWASLVAQWLRIHLPMQGAWVQALVLEDPTCRRATKPVRHNYWDRMPQLLKPACLEPMLHNKRSHCNEKPVHLNEEEPPLTAARESPRAAMKTQHSQK